jgi:excisionase family DNA binding protein
VEKRPLSSDDVGNPALILAEALSTIIRDAVRDVLQEVNAAGADNAALISVPEAAQRLGLGMTKLRELIASGELRSVVVGTRRLLRPADLDAFASRQVSGG